MAEYLHRVSGGNLSPHSSASYDESVSETMIANVLAVCPDTDRNDVAKDLSITGSATRTINRILDGQFPAVVDLDIWCTSARSQDQENSKANQVTVKDTTVSTKSARSVEHEECSSDTDVYTDTDEDDVVILQEERKSLFSALKNRMDKKDSYRSGAEDVKSRDNSSMPTENSSSKRGHPRCNKSPRKRTSEVIDLSFSDDDNGGCEQIRLKHPQNYQSQTVGKDCITGEPFKRSSNKYMPPDKDKHLRKAYLEKFGRPFVDSSPNSSSSDSDSCDSSEPLSVLPCSWVSQSGVGRQSASDTGSVASGLGSRESTDDSQVDSGVPLKKKKRSPEEILHQKQEALAKKQAREKVQQAKKEEKEREKQARQQARDETKKQKEKEKLLKKADSMNQKTNRLDGCVKQILVCIDPGVLTDGQQPEDSLLIQKLGALGAEYKIQPHPTSASVTWQRALVEHDVAETLQISTKKSYVDENQVVISLPALTFVEMVSQFREETQNAAISVIAEGDNLRSFCKRILRIYPGKILTIAVIGLEKYFRDVKLTQQRQFRSAVLGPSSSDAEKPSGKGRKKNKGSGPSTVVSRVDVEEALVDLQLREPSCRVRMCETEEEFAELLAMFTKAIAEAPFKKKQPETFSFCVEGGEKGSVKVSKDGQGLRKVWQQHFQQFRNISADAAAAIVAVYPTPQSLLQAYRQCWSREEASKLLKDILVRRGAGVLATSRRIGPELSRRVHLLLTSEDGDMSMQ